MTYSVESPSPEFNLYIPTVPFQSVPVETSSSAANPPPDLIGIGGTGLGSPGLVPGLSNGFSGSQVHIISSSSPVPTQSNLSGSGPVTSYYGSTSQLHSVSPTAPPFIPKQIIRMVSDWCHQKSKPRHHFKYCHHLRVSPFPVSILSYSLFVSFKPFISKTTVTSSPP